jgi:crotonobetainyl-CoA:carnitine CoA-transferase CaiB-like acyl-CoA transferase
MDEGDAMRQRKAERAKPEVEGRVGADVVGGDAVAPATGRGPLQGLSVVERAEGVSAPYCGKLLADLGADVVKIETPGAGDRARRMGPFAHDDPGPDGSLLFNFLNLNKLGVTLDLTAGLGKELLARLLASADVFLFGGDARAIEAEGLAYASLRQAHPRLVGVYVTPFGLSGPYAERRSSELVSFQMSGLGFLTPGEKDLPRHLPPLKAGGHQAQMTAGMTAAAATMHAMFAREATGEGLLVDVSELEPLTSFQFMDVARSVYAGEPGTRGLRDFGQAVRCKDGAFNVFFMTEPQWQAFVEVMGNPEWARRPELQSRAGRTERQRELTALIEEWSSTRTKEEIYRLGQGRRVPLFPLNSVADAVDSAQVKSRGFVQELPLAGGSVAPGPTAPYRFSATPWAIRRAAPRLGQHNDEIFCGRLGLPAGDLLKARDAGIV